MKKLWTRLLLTAFLLGGGLVQAQTGLEALLAQLVVPVISSVANTVESAAFSTTDFAAIFADVDTFIEKNADKLAFDIAKGEGEYLDALGDLMAVPAGLRPAWHKDMQTQYAEATRKG